MSGSPEEPPTGEAPPRETKHLNKEPPLFVQVADQLQESMLDGWLSEGGRVPSSPQLGSYFKVSPATATKGIDRLVERGLLVKRRGLGTFVAAGARETILTERRRNFIANYLTPMLDEARLLGLSTTEPGTLIETVTHGRRAAAALGCRWRRDEKEPGDERWID
ncbi:GntR family transcriptional regulator [Nesterenkonia muleiensis]|uniref:GntR family transcriptional regulator n=1 Tax=Nesterenkonia muleiensis TaxID=2282648 RepID=UPI000E762302